MRMKYFLKVPYQPIEEKDQAIIVTLGTGSGSGTGSGTSSSNKSKDKLIYTGFNIAFAFNLSLP